MDEDLDGAAVVDLAPNEANSWSDMAKPLNRLQLARLRDEEGRRRRRESAQESREGNRVSLRPDFCRRFGTRRIDFSLQLSSSPPYYTNMHGYVDSFPVPMRLPQSTSAAPAKGSHKGKGKEKEQQGQSKLDTYDVVASWSSQERDDMQRKVAMASKREQLLSCRPCLLRSTNTLVFPSAVGYSTVVMSISILATTNPASLVFPTPLFPSLDPRTAPKGTTGLVLQLWKIHVQDYTDEHIKSASVKGYHGFVRPSPL